MNVLGGIFLFGVAVAFFALWLYALISAIKNERLDPTMRIVWVLVVILVNGLGAVIYLLVAPNRPSQEEINLQATLRRRDEIQRAARRA
ncbi:MAG: PLDc N-terminal domain-containing protein [Candidatus Didemnitutus sp.]|nr:PLDc N-terminal domain-containing protein [Candidatus Didemnitutus sp.]